MPSLRQAGSSWYLLGSTVNNRLANTTYDAMGNPTQLSVSAGTVASYDAENRMSKIAVGGSEIASYTYDAEGRRVAKTAGGATTYYVYDAFGQLMAEYGGPAQTAGTRYFTTDYLGSTRMILNGTGGCVERLDYAPFGGQISRSGQDCYGGASSEKPLFTGQMRDGESTAGTETGQDYFSARYFWANTARFTSPDAPFADQSPADGQSWNMYAYVRNNPLRYVDPSGNYWVEPSHGGRLFKVYREDALSSRIGRLSWGKLLDTASRRSRGDTNTSLLPIVGGPFEHDRLFSLGSPDRYTIAEGVKLDQSVFHAFATEFGQMENIQSGGRPASMLLTRAEVQTFHDFHTAFRYGQEIQKREQRLATENDPKKAAKLRNEIDQRKGTREYKKYGVIVQKYIRKPGNEEEEDSH